MDHYADAFQAQPGQCWRMVTAPDGTGHPTHCVEPPAWRARTQITRGINRGKWYVVDSCDGHVDESLVGAKRITPTAVEAASYTDADGTTADTG